MTLAARTKLGPYEIVAPIGAGGMGEVYRARDLRLEREVAIKVLPVDVSRDRTRIARFEREAKILASLNHPNVVTIHEINSLEGISFIAMEYIRGRELRRVLRQLERIPLSEIVGYGIQVAEALAAAHRASIVHRDVKPSNIMLTDDGLIKVLDFGLAKVSERIESTINPVTQPGVAVGTTHYMSPEQASGDEIGPASDVFSFGVVMYEMLSHKRPFEGGSQAELFRAILTADPAPLTSVAPHVPPDLAAVVHRCLKPKPDARYRDGGHLVRELREVQRRLSQEGQDRSTTVTIAVEPPRKIRWNPRRIWITAAIGAVLATGFAAYVALGHGRWPIALPSVSSPASSAVLQEAKAYLQRYDRPGNIDRAIEKLERELKTDPHNAALEAALTEAYTRKYTKTSDKEWLRKARELGQTAVTANDDLAMAHQALGTALAEEGQNDDAVRELNRALDLDPLSSQATLGLAKIRASQHRPDEAGELFRRAIELSPGDWRPLHEAGRFAFRQARYPEAIEGWSKAVALTPDNTVLMSALGAGYHMNGQYAEAASTFQRVLEVDPTGMVWSNFGTARLYQGRYAEAVPALEKATQLEPNKSLYWGNLGDAYRWSHLKEKAAGAYKRAIQLARDALQVNERDTLTRSRLGLYLANSGDSTHALAAIAEARQQAPDDATVLFNSALVYEITHNRDKAFDSLERAIGLGYSMHEVANNAELLSLRSSPRYQDLLQKHKTLAAPIKKE
jgi:serine/threonine-protein kinase